MAEEDEIDVLGDFSLDNILSKNESAIFDNSALVSQNSDFFNCDYTIHPQWLLDKPSANPACWYNTNNSLDLTDFEQSQNAPLTTENSINDESGWTEKEKSLLNRGIEIFGKSFTRLSQFVGTKTPAEVKYFLCNFYSDVQLAYTSVSEDVLFERSCIQESINAERNVTEAETIQDSEIPASIEEVIATVTTADTTVNTSKYKKANISSKKLGYSILKSPLVQSRTFPDKNKTMLHSKKSSPKVKFKAAVKLTNASLVKKRRIRKKSVKELVNKNNLNASTNNEINIICGKNMSIPVDSGEEVIKIQKETASNSDSDIEIDIEDDDIQTSKPVTSQSNDILSISHNLNSESQTSNNNNEPISDFILDTFKINNQPIKIHNSKTQSTLDYTGLAAQAIAFVQSEKFPEKEFILPVNEVTELEKFIFNDYFEGKPSKTPNRYLRIRNHIMDAWFHIKPTYVTKTSIRQGLKNCGDVKNIGNIHNLLEQIGAINFGAVQVNYTRPLSDWILALQNTDKTRKKPVTIPTKMDVEKVQFRSRLKKFVNDGEGGCTLTHNESGSIIKVTVINEDPVQKARAQIKKPNVRLIYCRAFPELRKQEHRVGLSLSALLLMDLHAHMSLTEVMGLVGGRLSGGHLVHITRYVACRNVAPSLTHCDMCPVSQAKATEVLSEQGLRVLGWFHSHPTFAPEPSQTDIDTQLSVQQWLGRGACIDVNAGAPEPPCLGLILSPFSSQGALIASPYRCMIVEQLPKGKGKGVTLDGSEYIPYKFHVELVTDDFDVDSFLNEAWNLLQSEHSIPAQKRLNFQEAYYQDESLTYLDKFITSVKMHLAKCKNLNKMTCDLIVDGLSDLCLNCV